MLNGQVFSDQLFESHIFALFINTFVDGHNGIAENYKNGMEVSYSGSNVTIDTGAILIQGRYLEEDAGTTIDAGTANNYCKLVITINLDLVNTESNFNQGKYEILTDSSDYPTLTQQDIVNTNSGIYQYELAQFRTSAGGITDFVDKRTFLDIDALYTALQNQYATSIGDLSELDTTDQTSLVNAINEVYGIASAAEVVERGYTNGGSYLKFSNGAMICWSTFNRTFIATTASGSLYRGSITIGSTPQTFIGNPVIFVSALELGFIQGAITGVSTTSYGTLSFYTTASTGSSGYGGYVSVLALGRWK